MNHDTRNHLIALRRNLLRWYRAGQRELPWRQRADDPYAQWLAEMMLQQTQAATVIPYYERFLARFPTVADLAKGSREEVLALWAGLGYYRRAHHLHDAAQMVARELDGAFPDTVDGLKNLPGVGRYTAGAIASIAFNRRAPILDGNVRRVLARLFGIYKHPDEPATLKRLWELAEEILPKKHCGDFNQGVMDLGALVCTPQNAQCDACPLRNQCEAHRENAVDIIPPPRRRARVVNITMFAFIIQSHGAILLRRRPDSGLWSGMWECPSVEVDEENGGGGGGDFADAAAKLLPASVLQAMGAWQLAGSVSHQLTHRTIRFEIRTARAPRSQLPESFQWAKRTALPPMPRAFVKVIAVCGGSCC